MTFEDPTADPRAGSAESVRGGPYHLLLIALFVTGAVMLGWSGVLHVYLWGKEDGYRAVPTVGHLFLIQGILGCVLGVVAVVYRRLLVALAGAIYMAASIGALYKAIHGGLFGYGETSDAPYVQMSFVVEFIGLVAFVAAMIVMSAGPRRRAAV
jgi:hypothetical protein